MPIFLEILEIGQQMKFEHLKIFLDHVLIIPSSIVR
jgi:hypothetical protein